MRTGISTSPWPFRCVERFIIAGPRGYSKARYTKRLQNIQKTCQRNSQRSQKVLALLCVDARPLEKGMKACRTQK